MKRMSDKWMGRVPRALLCASLCLGITGIAVAAPLGLDGAQTPLKDRSERIISLHHQNHLREPADGATCLALNRGTTRGQTLLLQQSADNNLQRALLFSVPLA